MVGARCQGIRHQSGARRCAIAPLAAIGGDRIAHNRAEQEFGPSGSAGGEQIAHNRSEEGFTQWLVSSGFGGDAFASFATSPEFGICESASGAACHERVMGRS